MPSRVPLCYFKCDKVPDGCLNSKEKLMTCRLLCHYENVIKSSIVDPSSRKYVMQCAVGFS